MNSLFVIPILFLATSAVHSGDGPVSTDQKPEMNQTVKRELPPPMRNLAFQGESNPAGGKVRRVRDESARPRMSGSATGYIDNAIVGSQIRIRVDPAFEVQAPDRAEFFYGKCGCYRGLVGQSAFDPNAPGPGNGIETGSNFQEVHINLEYSPRSRFSVFTEIPWRAIQPTTFSNARGISDVRAGFKFALDATPDRAITFQLRTYFPSGDALRGLGTHHYTIEPSLLYHQRVSPRVALSSQFGDWHPIGGSAGAFPDNGINGKGTNPPISKDGFAGDILNYGFGASYDLVSRPAYRFTPVVEAVGWSVLSGFATVPGLGPVAASGTNVVNLKLGARLTFGEHSSIYAGYGHALTHAHWYEDIVRIEYRWAF